MKNLSSVKAIVELNILTITAAKKHIRISLITIIRNNVDGKKMEIKRQRQDRKEKLIKRKDTIETVVKSSLLKYINVNPKKPFQNAIKARVEAFSKRVRSMSLALNTIIKEIFNNQEDVLSVQLPDIFEQTFIRQLMLGLESCRRTYQNFDLDKFFLCHPKLLNSDLPRHIGDRNIYSAGAKKYLVNLKNFLRVNLDLFIRRFLKAYQDVNNLDDDSRVGMMYRLFGWEMPKDVLKAYNETEQIRSDIAVHRKILGLNDTDNKALDPKICPLENILKYFVFLNRYNEQHDLKRFNIVPICTIRAHYITIDTSVCYGIAKECSLINCNTKVFESMADVHWSTLFKIDKLQGKNNKFTNTIETDGEVMSSHFIRPKKKGDCPNVEVTSSDRVVAIDPGRTNIYYGVEKLNDGTIKTYKLTRGRYYVESGIINAKKQTSKWQKLIKSEADILSTVSSKGVKIENHYAFLDTLYTIENALWDEYIKPRWSRQRFRLYGGKKRVFSRFLNTIQDFDKSRQAIIAFGSAKFAPTGKGEVAVPTSRAFKECNYRFPIKLIDEFRTSKICYFDDSILTRVQYKDSNTKSCLRGLLWCSSPNNSKFVSRDLNGGACG